MPMSTIVLDLASRDEIRPAPAAIGDFTVVECNCVSKQIKRRGSTMHSSVDHKGCLSSNFTPGMGSPSHICFTTQVILRTCLGLNRSHQQKSLCGARSCALSKPSPGTLTQI
jgi:hypothetical protein